jgi:hypothetical protein
MTFRPVQPNQVQWPALVGRVTLLRRWRYSPEGHGLQNTDGAIVGRVSLVLLNANGSVTVIFDTPADSLATAVIQPLEYVEVETYAAV